MSEMTESKIMAFMKILKSMGMPRATTIAITAMMDDKTEKADEMVRFIEKNPNATETVLLKKAQEISKNIDYDKRIQTFSKSTMQLIMDRMTSEENLLIIRDIVLSSDTEEEVVKRLKEELIYKG